MPKAAAAADTVSAIGGTCWDKLAWRGAPLGVPGGLVGTDLLAGTARCSDVLSLASAPFKQSSCIEPKHAHLAVHWTLQTQKQLRT